MLKSLNDIIETDYEEIKAMASVFFTPKQIAIALEIDIASFIHECNTEGSKCYIAFEGGRLKSEYELRLSIMKLAKSGSSPAQTMALDMLKNSTMKMMEI